MEVKKNKSFYVESLGCVKNQVDSEKMASELIKNGYKNVKVIEEAEIIIINTCGFIESAKKEAVDTIFEMLDYKKIGNCEQIIVAGCLAERYSESLAEEIPEIDKIFGIGDISRIIEIIESDKKVNISDEKLDLLKDREILDFIGTAYLRIGDGCSNHCSYCAIPLIRGENRSRLIEDIVDEFDIINKKYNLKEIILISQDTTNYGNDLNNEVNIADITGEIDKKLDQQWLRVLYMHPDHLTESVLQKLAGFKNFVPYFDLPFQSGSDKILKLMNRKNSTSENLKLIALIRKYFQNPVIRSTFIVGFPGETEKEFAETMDFITKAQLDWVGAFKYSEEEGTAAYSFKQTTTEEIINQRYDRLIDLTEQISFSKINEFVGKRMRVLVEEKIEEENFYIGRFYGQAPDVDGLIVIYADDDEVLDIGNFYECDIVKQNGRDLLARV